MTILVPIMTRHAAWPKWACLLLHDKYRAGLCSRCDKEGALAVHTRSTNCTSAQQGARSISDDCNHWAIDAKIISLLHRCAKHNESSTAYEQGLTTHKDCTPLRRIEGRILKLQTQVHSGCPLHNPAHLQGLLKLCLSLVLRHKLCSVLV